MVVLFPHDRKQEAPSGSLPSYSETEVVSLTNQERQEYGLPALQRDLKLSAAAKAKADKLVKCGCFQHTLPDGQTAWDLLKEVKYDYFAAGENLAIAYTDASAMMESWMGSAGHRANILKKEYKQIGVGIADAADYRIVVQIFGDPVPEKMELQGKASYYDYVLDSGWSSKGHRVCATRDWKRGTYVEVTNVVNGKKVICKVTDYGPEYARHPDRIVDLSSYAFSQLADLKAGIIQVSIKEVEE